MPSFEAKQFCKSFVGEAGVVATGADEIAVGGRCVGMQTAHVALNHTRYAPGVNGTDYAKRLVVGQRDCGRRFFQIDGYHLVGNMLCQLPGHETTVATARITKYHDGFVYVCF